MLVIAYFVLVHPAMSVHQHLDTSHALWQVMLCLYFKKCNRRKGLKLTAAHDVPGDPRVSVVVRSTAA